MSRGPIEVQVIVDTGGSETPPRLMSRGPIEVSLPPSPIAGTGWPPRLMSRGPIEVTGAA